MRRFVPAVLGIVVGLVAALWVVSPRDQPYSTSLVSDCDGPLGRIVVQYVPDSHDVVMPVYRQFIPGLPRDVVVYAVCPDRAAFDRFASALPEHNCTIRPVLTGHEMTAWSRDRWLSLAHRPGPGATLLAPRGEDGAASWPARAGDQRIAEDLADALPDVHADRSGLWFDGGDFVADQHTVFVTPRVARRNVNRTVADREELVKQLEQVFGRTVVLLDEAPDHHAGMFMMPTRSRTMLVGDPSLGEQWIARDVTWDEFEMDRSPQTQRLFDAVARQCEAAGYHVQRMGVVVGTDGRTWLTPLNVIIDESLGRAVYMPTFRGASIFNTHAAGVWSNLGYQIKPVDCTSSYRHFGSLRCLVNVISRR
jgi:hypothetical protein